MIRFPVT